MKLRGIIASALALALSVSLAFAQANQGTSPLTIAKGGTAASTESGARTSLGVPTGTSGHALGFLDAANTWTGLQTYSATGAAFSVFSSGATANAYSNWQNGTRQWIVGVDADSACASGSATAFIFYDQTATACRGWLSTDGGWIFGSSTTSPGAGNINLTGGAVWNNGIAPTGTGAYVRATSPTLTLTNATGLPLSGHTAQGAYTIVANNSGSSAAPTAVDVTAITAKAAPVSADIVLIQDSAASNAFKKTTVGAIGSVGSVASIAGNTGAFTLSNGLTNSTNDLQIDPAYGGWRLLSTLTASSSATLEDSANITSTYNEYEIVFENILPATNNVICEMRSRSGGSYQSTSYLANEMHSSGGVVAANAATTYIPCGVAALTTLNSGPGISGRFNLYKPSQTTSPKSITGIFSHTVSGPANVGGTVSGYWNGGNGAVDGIQVLFSSGNIASGVVKIYGRK